MAVDERRIAVLGAGKIGEALISGLLSSGWREPRDIVATGRRPERLDELEEAIPHSHARSRTPRRRAAPRWS